MAVMHVFPSITTTATFGGGCGVEKTIEIWWC